MAWSPADELRLLVIHGALHICGWDHAEPEEEAEMRALERGCSGRARLAAMSTIRVGVASTPLTATLDEAVPAAVAAIEEAGRLGARIVCLPETTLPGHRDQPRVVPDVAAEALEDALREVGDAAAARRGGRHRRRGAADRRPAARSCRSCSMPTGTASASRSRRRSTRPRRPGTSPAAAGARSRSSGLTFGIAICHEAYRYPEITRALALAGAQVVFVPHYVVTDDGSLPTRWCDATNPYNEKSLLLRALENTIYIGASNVAGASQGSITGIIAPDGTLVASLPYGQVGVAVADHRPRARADRLIARRWAPERSLPAGTG